MGLSLKRESITVSSSSGTFTLVSLVCGTMLWACAALLDAFGFGFVLRMEALLRWRTRRGDNRRRSTEEGACRSDILLGHSRNEHSGFEVRMLWNWNDRVNGSACLVGGKKGRI